MTHPKITIFDAQLSSVFFVTDPFRAVAVFGESDTNRFDIFLLRKKASIADVAVLLSVPRQDDRSFLGRLLSPAPVTLSFIPVQKMLSELSSDNGPFDDRLPPFVVLAEEFEPELLRALSVGKLRGKLKALAMEADSTTLDMVSTTLRERFDDRRNASNQNAEGFTGVLGIKLIAGLRKIAIGSGSVKKFVREYPELSQVADLQELFEKDRARLGVSIPNRPR